MHGDSFFYFHSFSVIKLIGFLSCILGRSRQVAVNLNCWEIFIMEMREGENFDVHSEGVIILIIIYFSKIGNSSVIDSKTFTLVHNFVKAHMDNCKFSGIAFK